MQLKDARLAVGLSQAQLDDLAGLRRGTTADIEQGRNSRPAHETVTRYVRAFRRKGLQTISAETLFPVPNDGGIDITEEAAPTRERRKATEDRRKGGRRRENRLTAPDRRREARRG
ncbi:MAG: helix-turn-helix domain-containing protein [Vicinamibacterales bacterium]